MMCGLCAGPCECGAEYEVRINGVRWPWGQATTQPALLGRRPVPGPSPLERMALASGVPCSRFPAAADLDALLAAFHGWDANGGPA